LTSHISNEKALEEETVALEVKIAEMLKAQEEAKVKAQAEEDAESNKVTALETEKKELESKIANMLNIAKEATIKAQADQEQKTQKMQGLLSTKESLENNLTSHISHEKALEEEKVLLEAKIAEMLNAKAEAEAKAKEEAEKAKEEAEAEAKAKEEAEKAKAEEDRLAKEKAEAERVSAELERLADEKALKEELALATQKAEDKMAEKKLSDVFALTHVEFKFNSMDLTSNSKKLLNRASDTIKKYTQFSYKIKGYTDDRGRAEYNLKLSGQRANKVKEYLVLQGVDASILTSEGFGEENPITSNDTKAGRKQNRRVMFEIVK